MTAHPDRQNRLPKWLLPNTRGYTFSVNQAGPLCPRACLCFCPPSKETSGCSPPYRRWELSAVLLCVAMRLLLYFIVWRIGTPPINVLGDTCETVVGLQLLVVCRNAVPVVVAARSLLGHMSETIVCLQLLSVRRNAVPIVLSGAAAQTQEACSATHEKPLPVCNCCLSVGTRFLLYCPAQRRKHKKPARLHMRNRCLSATVVCP